MGRPREYDENTASALLDAAEQLVSEGGLEAISVRRLANAIGVTVQAVYSLFGSKEGLVVALGARAFTLLSEGLDSLPTTDDPINDLVEAGAIVFRNFAISHPALLTIGFQQIEVPPEIARGFRSAQEDALARLHTRIRRMMSMAQRQTRGEAQAGLEFHALCEGLAMMERRWILRPDEAVQTWRDALGALVVGWVATGPES